jgi:flagellar protein FlgJ
MAQAALETGWGRSMPVDESGRPSFNLFGIKATGNWRGAVASSVTTEFVGQRATRQVDNFRAYDNLDQSIADHARLLSGSPRYAAALNSGDDIHAYATALQRGGYATDPQYARKLVSVAESLDQVLGGARS